MKAETKFDVAGVLAEHLAQHTMVYDVDWHCRCRDEWAAIEVLVSTAEDVHPTHLSAVCAAAISAHIAETLGSSAVFDAVTLAISDIRDDYPRLPTDADSGACADAALAAVGDLLGVEVGR